MSTAQVGMYSAGTGEPPDTAKLSCFLVLAAVDCSYLLCYRLSYHHYVVFALCGPTTPSQQPVKCSEAEGAEALPSCQLYCYSCGLLAGRPMLQTYLL